MSRGQRLADLVATSRATVVTVPEQQRNASGRLALLRLAAYQLSLARRQHDGPQGEPAPQPPCLLVTGATGQELDALAAELLRVADHGCRVAVECGRLLRCDGRSLRLLRARSGAVADTRQLPASHPLVHAGLVPVRRRAGKRRRDTLLYFGASARRPVQVRPPALPAHQLGHSRMLRQTGLAAGVEAGQCADAVRRCRDAGRAHRARRQHAVSLDQAFTVDGLQQGFLRVRQAGGGAGVDGVSPGQFEQDLERRLRRLSAEILGGRYRPRKLNRVSLPKRGGGRRNIDVAAVHDRVVQSAMALPLGRLVDPTLCASVYGYRQGIGVHTASPLTG